MSRPIVRWSCVAVCLVGVTWEGAAYARPFAMTLWITGVLIAALGPPPPPKPTPAAPPPLPPVPPDRRATLVAELADAVYDCDLGWLETWPTEEIHARLTEVLERHGVIR